MAVLPGGSSSLVGLAGSLFLVIASINLVAPKVATPFIVPIPKALRTGAAIAAKKGKKKAMIVFLMSGLFLTAGLNDQGRQ
ncbi:hypothetical protein HZF02_06255 [Pseudomonas yamanorum]|nr:hypothetical protein HZF02_06255 [Pseudomonas yamanorum]